MFNLTDYVDSIHGIATANKVSYPEAVYQFITNLTVMREVNKGAPNINFHTLGQEWNKLLYKEKLSQKTAALKADVTTRRMNRRASEGT